MKKIGIFYGSTTGTTAKVARKIAKALEVDEKDVLNVAETAPSKLGDYDLIIMGSSTWGNGDVQSSYYDFLDGAQMLDLSDKEIALFGCGDETMSESFCNAVGDLYNRLKPTRAKFIGFFNADGYTFEDSSARRDGTYVGLLLDEKNHPELTDLRIAEWVNSLA